MQHFFKNGSQILMVKRTKLILMLTCLNLMEKQIDRHDSNLYWPTTIKDRIWWFPFLAILEHTATILNPNTGLFPSLLKVFAMFEFRLIDYKDKFDSIVIRFINCKKSTGFFLRNSTFEEMITKFVLNAIFHRMGMSWIIRSNDEM